MPKRLDMVILLVSGFVCSLSGCQSPNYTHRGATLGGITGGGVGAIVGEVAADQPLVGAVVGSAVGAMTGASLGGALDEIEARNQQRVNQAVYAQETAGTSLQEIVALTESGLSDDIITRHIRSHGFTRPLSAQDLIDLRQSGVNDHVIAAMQDAALKPHFARAAADPPPVFVEEHVPVLPLWRYRHAWPRRWPPHRGVHWGISFGH